MADNKVNFLRGTSAEYETKTKDNDTFYYTADTKKLYLGENEITGIEIDDISTTATDKTWSAKKINDSIPTSLPADGGNADTVDGKHASDFMQNLGFLTTGSLLDYVLTMTESGYLFVSGSVTDTPVSGQFFFVDVRRYAGGHYAITATRFNAGGVYTNRYNNNSDMKKWYGWANVADGGNAATVNGYTVNANVPAGFSPDNMMSKTNPTGTGSFSLNRKADTTIGNYSFAEGSETTASGEFSHAEGNSTTASASYTHAEGVNTSAIGQSSHAEGSNLEQNRYNEIVFEEPRRAEVYDNATGDFIYITVAGSQAFGLNSHAEGCSTLAYGKNSHTEGYHSVASANESHAEGCGCETSGSFAHAEGFETKASGSNGSHVEGYRTTASGSSSHAEGYYAKAANYASHASGKYNAAMTTGGGTSNTTGTAFVIGNGTSTSALSNAFSVQFSGIVKAKSTITASTTADYAEFFEWLDGNPDDEDRVGYFVTLDGDKIRIATAADDYILGVVSGEPFVLGNGDCDTWNGMYLHDEFRRTIYEPAPKMVEILDSEGNPTGEYEEVEGEFEGTRPKLNPEYDHTQPYISRLDRKEWAPVGMLGVLAVRHDGTAQVNGYVTVNADGIATACEKSAENAYRVIKSNTDSVVEIIFR